MSSFKSLILIFFITKFLTTIQNNDNTMLCYDK